MTKAEREKREYEQLKLDICDEICMKIFEEVSFPAGEHIITASRRLKTKWGLCTAPAKKGEPYKISISADLLADDVDESFLLGTVGHELLHTCQDGNFMMHSKAFMKRAETLYQKGIYANLGCELDSLHFKKSIVIHCKCKEKFVTSIKNEKMTTTCPICRKTYHIFKDTAVYENGENLKVTEYKKSRLCPL